MEMGEEFSQIWKTVLRGYRESANEWVKSLREQGFKAAHPNDGWVDRKNKNFTMMYPHFNDGIKIGDKVMLGYHFDGSDVQKAVMITAITTSNFTTSSPIYSFEYLENGDAWKT